MPFLDHLDSLEPTRFLAVIDLPEVQNLTLNDPIALGASILDDAPIPVLFSVLEAGFSTQEHASSVREKISQIKVVGWHYTPFCASWNHSGTTNQAVGNLSALQFAEIRGELRKSG